MHIAERIPLNPLVRVSQITRAVCALPAIATLDWCDRAAACLCLAGEPATAVFMLAEADERGQVLSREAVGVGATHAVPGEPDDPALTALRSRGHRLTAVGFAPLDLLRPTVTVLDRVSPEWRTGPVGRLIGGQARAEVVVGTAPLTDEPGLVVIAYLAASGAAGEAAAVLEAAFPLLVARAAACLSAGRAGERSWLTLREQEVLEQLTLGKSVKEIAESLGRSPHTVHDHVKALHRKLSASTRGELIARALGHLPAPRAAVQVEPKPALRVDPGLPLTRAG